MLHYVAIACVLAAVTAAPSSLIDQGIAIGSVSNPSYGFNYAVSDPLTGDNKAQAEQRVGGVVRGSYSLAEADGTVRVVDYSADPVTGFNAVVKRLGTAAHPQQIALAPITPVITKSVAPVAIGQGLIGIGDLGLGLKGLELNSLGLGLGLKGGLGLGGLGITNLGALGLGHDSGLLKY